MNMDFQLVWTRYGDGLAVGIRNLSESKFLIKQIYNLFYNYGVTNGDFHEMNDGKFGYFLSKPANLLKTKKINTELGKKINTFIKSDFVEERFLIE